MKTPIYLDYSATTPVDTRVAQKMIPWLTEHFGNALQREIVRLGTTAGEDDFFGRCADQIRNLFSSLLGSLFRFPPEPMVP